MEGELADDGPFLRVLGPWTVQWWSAELIALPLPWNPALFCSGFLIATKTQVANSLYQSHTGCSHSFIQHLVQWHHCGDWQFRNEWPESSQFSQSLHEMGNSTTESIFICSVFCRECFKAMGGGAHSGFARVSRIWVMTSMPKKYRECWGERVLRKHQGEHSARLS